VYCVVKHLIQGVGISAIYLGVGYRVAYPSARQCESPDAG